MKTLTHQEAYERLKEFKECYQSANEYIYWHAPPTSPKEWDAFFALPFYCNTEKPVDPKEQELKKIVDAAIGSYIEGFEKLQMEVIGLEEKIIKRVADAVRGADKKWEPLVGKSWIELFAEELEGK